MSHISCWKINFLKSVYYRITLSSPHYLSHPIPLDYTPATTWGQGPSLTSYFPNAEHNVWHKICVQLMFITWISESVNKVFLRSNTKLSRNTVKSISPPLRNLRILTSQVGRPRTHRQHLWQILFVPYLPPHVFHGIRPLTEFKWSFSAILPILDWSKSTVTVLLLLPV